MRRARKAIQAAVKPSDLAPIAIVADLAISAAAADQPGPRTFEVVAYTGGELRVAGYHLPVVVDLKGLSAAKSIIANLDHDRQQRVGHVTKFENDKSQVKLTGQISARTPAAEEVLGSYDQGFPWQASIEALPAQLVEIGAGVTVEINGRTFQGPIFHAKKSKLRGFAFVTQGADDNTSVKIAAAASDAQQDDAMPPFEKWILAFGFDSVDELNDKQKAALRTKYDAEVKAAATDTGSAGRRAKPKARPQLEDDDPPPGTAFDIDELRAAHSEHLAAIEATLFEHEDAIADKKALAKIKAEALKTARELKAQAIREEWAPTRYEVEAIKAAAKVEVELIRAERPTGPAIHSASANLSERVIEAAMCQTLRIDGTDEAYDDATNQAAHTQFRGRMGLQQLLILAAVANGMTLRAGDKIHNGNLREALQFACTPLICGGFSTLSLPGLLSNVANKEILMGYKEEDQTWREIAVVKSVSDFKQTTSYRLLDNMEFEPIGPTGKIKHGTLGEESYTRQAKTYAKMYSLTRDHFINDDLEALQEIRTRVGAGGAKKLNNVFWTRFLDNASFFTSARGNYITGATTNLGIDGVGLEAGVTAFRKMRTTAADGKKRIGGRPSILLVPPELEFIATRLYASVAVNTGGAATATSVPDANIHANKYRPVVCDWLSDADFTGNSATAWYLFRDLGQGAAMAVSFLNGVQEPTVESADADFSQLGVDFRGYFDFGCDLAEPLAGLKSKGAA